MKLMYVFECTGKFNSKEDTEIHIKNGAKKVIISAPREECRRHNSLRC